MQVGGGLRDVPAVEAVLEAGARWAVVGTRAALDPAFLGEVCGAFEDRIIVAVDATDGRVAVDGWRRVLDLDATALARDAAAAGAAAILYTDIARDGTEAGPNLWSTDGGGAGRGHPRARLGRRGLARGHPPARRLSRRGGRRSSAARSTPGPSTCAAPRPLVG